jgi:hypothetical protein
MYHRCYRCAYTQICGCCHPCTTAQLLSLHDGWCCLRRSGRHGWCSSIDALLLLPFAIGQHRFWICCVGVLRLTAVLVVRVVMVDICEKQLVLLLRLSQI